MAGNNYLMLRTAMSDLLKGGMIGRLERTPLEIASFYLHNYSEEDLSYIKLAPKIGVGGPGKVIEEHSY